MFGIIIAPRFPGAATGITTVNLNSSKVRAWATGYLMGWMREGVDGFRIDHMMDDLDNKHILTNLFGSFWKPIFAKLRAANPKLAIIAEQYDWGDGADFLRHGGVDAAFAFPLTSAIRSFDKAKIVAAIDRLDQAIPPGKHELTFVENHDMSRIASDPGITPEKLRTAATLMVLLKGTPSIYYGQELGMRGTTRDEYKSDEREIGTREAFKWTALDEAPGEAIWYKGPKTYWTERFARDHDGISVEEEDQDSHSLLNHYRKLLKLRAAHAAFRSDEQRILQSPKNILAVERTGGEHLLIVANLSEKPADYSVAGRELLTGARVTSVHLRAYQSAVIAR